MDAHQPSSGGPLSVGPPVSDRLDSWKAIALYLKRDIRTVQRWEASEGLPVYRHQHSKYGSIYAYKSEIEAWWRARPSAQRPRQAETDREQKRTRASLSVSYPRLAIYAILIVILAFSIVEAKQMFLNRQTASAILLQPPSIAVLPFQSSSISSDGNILAHAITSDVVSALSGSKALHLVDNESLLNFANSAEGDRKIAKMLHADKFLRGTADRSANGINITAELIDSASGRAVWSCQFERNEEDLAKNEKEIATAIVADVEKALSRALQEPPNR